MDVRNIAVVVEDVDAARTALQWALHNIIRYGDIITLLHVYPFTRSKTKNKILRLRGFQLALSFQDICNNFSNTKVEIVVTEENQEGMKIVATVREIGASILVVGLHDHSFLYRVPDIRPPKVKYRICPDPTAIICRLRRSRKTTDEMNVNSSSISPTIKANLGEASMTREANLDHKVKVGGRKVDQEEEELKKEEEEENMLLLALNVS
ncbi:hypothetical protein Fmac_012731 [Flemingia macrophylla]|uniref:UspA domain-containing protein n=1 Tax=Flemingia macrophylla TaxID=520843 RepID=A0ABD1MTB9_9FABA